MPRVDDCRTATPLPDRTIEYLNGTIIGGEDDGHYGKCRYAFYNPGTGQRVYDADQWFDDDAEAQAWLRAWLKTWPSRGMYPNGIEMRCYCD